MSNATAPRRLAIRRRARGWERWDNRAGEWQLLPFQYLDVCEYDARMYASGRYGCFFRQVNVEAPA